MRRLACGLLLIAACGGDDAACPVFALTEPDGFAELMPGATVTVAWTGDGAADAPVRLVARSTDLPQMVSLPEARLGDGRLAWDGGGARPGNYRLGGEVGAIDGCDAVAITADDLHLIVVQGLRMPADAIAFAGSQPGRTVQITTVTRSVMMVRLALDPDGATDGDELVFVQTTVPGEFTPVARTYPFSGLTTDGTAIPDGAYDLIALIGTPTAYRVVGPRLTWQSGE